MNYGRRSFTMWFIQYGQVARPCCMVFFQVNILFLDEANSFFFPHHENESKLFETLKWKTRKMNANGIVILKWEPVWCGVCLNTVDWAVSVSLVLPIQTLHLGWFPFQSIITSCRCVIRILDWNGRFSGFVFPGSERFHRKSIFDLDFPFIFLRAQLLEIT